VTLSPHPLLVQRSKIE